MKAPSGEQDTPTSRELLGRLKTGDHDAAECIVNRYTKRLIPLVRSQLAQKLQARIDAEDVVQSALGSFFIRACRGQFTLENPGDLWRLLATVSLNKLRRQTEKGKAAKRSIDREVGQLTLAADIVPSHEDVVAVMELAENAYQSLPRESQEAFRLSLAGASFDEIANTLGKSPRTIRRWLQGAEGYLQNHLYSPPKIEPDRRFTLSWEHYVLKKYVGQGGFGKVYRAIEKRHNRTVAIKSLHKRHQGNPAAIQCFVREAQVLAKVRHPNVVGVHGLGQYPGGGYFLVLDWISGEDLQQKIDRGPMPIGDAITTVRQIANGIQAAHDSGVIHGDLKPANILTSSTGGVIVTDFGLATSLNQPTLIPIPRGGTLAYLAPEQLHAESLDERVDIYGLGAILYAMLTGQPPRQGQSDEIITLIKNNQLPDQLLVEPDAHLSSSGLRNLILKCLEADPKHRFRNVSFFLQSLHEVPCP